MGYERRVVAYADVVGWSERCAKSSSYCDLLAATEGIAHHAESFSPATKKMLAGSGASAKQIDRHASIEFSFFSDNLAMSAPIHEAESLFRVMARASTDLLLRGFSCRGGVAVGDLHHKNGIVFGPALIEAVEREQAARYPRLSCGDGVAELIGDEARRARLLMRDHHGELILMNAVSSVHELGWLLAAVDKGQGDAPAHCQEKWLYLRTVLTQIFETTGGWKPCDQVP